MGTTANSHFSFDERKELFDERFDVDIDTSVTLMLLVNEAGRYLSHIIPGEYVEAGMRVMLKNSSWALAEDDWDDKVLGETYSAILCYPFVNEIEMLGAYGLFGILLPSEADQAELDSEQRLGDILNRANALLAATPLEQWLPQGVDRLPLIRVMMLANNRWNLDHGLPIEPEALAFFGGVTEARIRNLMSGQDRKFTNQDGQIPAQQALDWLADREDFFNSIWREHPTSQHSLSLSQTEQPLFVPVARDKTIFHPGLARSNGFSIGPKGAERQVKDYLEALAELQRMPIPYWRRPNDKGKFGIVRGVQWERHDPQSLAARTV